MAPVQKLQAIFSGYSVTLPSHFRHNTVISLSFFHVMLLPEHKMREIARNNHVMGN